MIAKAYYIAVDVWLPDHSHITGYYCRAENEDEALSETLAHAREQVTKYNLPQYRYRLPTRKDVQALDDMVNTDADD